jgi:hypothetical protein
METTFRDAIKAGSQQIAFIEDMGHQARVLADRTGDIKLNASLHELSGVWDKMAEVQAWNDLPEGDRRDRQVDLARSGLKMCWVALGRLRTLDES